VSAVDELGDEVDEEEDVAPVAAQSLESAVVVVVVAVVPAGFVFVTVALAALTVVVAALSVAWRAMVPPSPSSAATLVPAAILRARRAGCGRFRRGVASGISRSFDGGRTDRGDDALDVETSSEPEVRDREEAARKAGKKTPAAVLLPSRVGPVGFVRMATNEPGSRVLIAEDDRSVRESLVLALGVEGYDVEAVNDGAAALESIALREPDVIILDIMMPVLDGLTVCRRLRAGKCRTPILMLTARHEVSDRVSGLDAGADDYLAKPFSLDELLARLRALLRRTSVSGSEELLRVADLTLDPLRRRAERSGRVLELTKTEFDLLELLMLNAGIVLGRDTIYDRIWGFDFETGSRSLDVYIGYLRRKTEAEGEPRLLHTVRGVGYVVREP
jgi:two-component system response regulator MprA